MTAPWNRKSKVGWRSYDYLRRPIPDVYNYLFRLAAGVFGHKVAWWSSLIFIVIAPLFTLVNSNFSGIFGHTTQNQMPLDKKISEKGNVVSSPAPILKKDLEESVVLGESHNSCQGNNLDVIRSLDDVSDNEKPFNSDRDDPSVVTVGDSTTFQVVKRYPFSCKVPWTTTVVFTPRKAESIGVFLENEDTFKVLIGDGDRLTYTVQKNDQGRRENWTLVSKEELINGPITVNKEMTMTVTLESVIGNVVRIKVKFRYVPEGKEDYVWEEHKKEFKPLAVDLISKPSRPIRVGLNDSRFKGDGSEIKFGTFSVRELEKN